MAQVAGSIRIEMLGVRKRFGHTVALDGVDFSVAAGEVHALVGENGAGKSTLMKVLSGAETPDAGFMRLDGTAYSPADPHAARRSGVAMIYQELSLARHLTIRDNVFLGTEHARAGILRMREERELARRALVQLGHSDLDPDRGVDGLSPGEQQVVEIARALATGCRVLVLDEPTSSLTRGDVQLLFELVRRLKSQGHAIVYISHFLDEVREISDRFTVLRDGRSVGTGHSADTSVEAMVGMMVGRRIDQLYPRSNRTPSETVLTIQDLAGPVKPVCASLELRRGEVLGIAGLVGSGRTELLRVIFGLQPVRRGEISVGVYSGRATPGRRLQQGLGFLSEDRKSEGLATSLSLTDNVVLSNMSGLGPPGLAFPHRCRAAASRWIRQLNIRARHPDQLATDLSGGNQQKLALARLLHQNADILLLDEPTRGIDVASKVELYRLIDALALGDPVECRPSKAVLVVSSYLPELLGICDRIAVMNRGILGPARDVADWDEHSLLLEVSSQKEAA